MEIENIMSLFENEDIYGVPIHKDPDLHFKNRNFPGPLICIKNYDLTGSNLSFLEKIIKAIGYELSAQCDVAIFDNDKKYSFKEIIKTPISGQTIFFGNFQDILDLNLNNKLNEWIYISNMYVLFSYNLEDLHKDQGKKQELWKILKTKYQ